MNLSKTIIAILFITLLGNACKEENAQENLVETTTTKAEQKGMNLANLLGTWVDTSDNDKSFSLYNDGSVDHKNIQELELKDWTLEEGQLVFARKNSSGEQTSMNAERYDIIDLTDSQLTISKEGDTLIYKKQ